MNLEDSEKSGEEFLIDKYVAIEPIFLCDNAEYSQEVQVAQEVLLHPGEENNV